MELIIYRMTQMAFCERTGKDEILYQRTFFVTSREEYEKRKKDAKDLKFLKFNKIAHLYDGEMIELSSMLNKYFDELQKQDEERW